MKDLRTVIVQMFTPGTVACTVFGAVLGIVFAVLCLTIGVGKAVLIGVSENPESAIAQNADIYLEVKTDREPDPFNMLATASTLSVISLFDGICIALAQRKGFSREQFAVIHPHGAVGARLLNNLA